MYRPTFGKLPHSPLAKEHKDKAVPKVQTVPRKRAVLRKNVHILTEINLQCIG